MGRRDGLRGSALVCIAGLGLLAGCGKSSSGTGGTGGVTGAGGKGSGGTPATGGTSGAGTTGQNTPDGGIDAPAGGGTGGSTAGTGGGGASGGGGQTATGGTTGAGGAFAIYTQHNDMARSGVNARETILTPANVNVAKFGKVFAQPVDGFLYAQPLYVPNVTIPGKGVHNVVYIASEHDTVYAFDADTKQAPLWQVSFLSTGVVPIPEVETSSPTLKPEVGITGTPVIDPATNTMYLVAATKEPGPKYVDRLHALDITTGAEKLGGPVVITGAIAGTGANNVMSPAGMVVLDLLRELQRPGLALSNGTVYIAFTGNGDHNHWHGWVLGYDATTLAQKSIYCTTPDKEAGSIWMSGAGIAVDPSGNLYVETGNGAFDLPTGGRNASMSVLKLDPMNKLVDWFAPHDAVALSNADVDLGSTSVLILPDSIGVPGHPHLMIGSGKPGYLYMLDRDSLGHITADDSQIVQKVSVHPNTNGPSAGIYSQPIYWNGFVFTSAIGDKVKAFSLTNGVLSTVPTSQSLNNFSQPGALTSLSANGNTAGIIWAGEGDGYQPVGNAALHAYDALDLTKELWNSNQATGMRDQAALVAKNAVPTIANGRVYFGTQTELEVYGLLPP
ncbi:MAG TPA: pyrrolo-quinoline quinone [Polyangia bacterium]|nr:pyrrolo-quinoline quinone [Polyangia bacterium]